MEIKDLKPGQKVIIVDEKYVWPVEVQEVRPDNSIDAMFLVDRSFFIYDHPEDIKEIKPWEGKTIRKSEPDIRCPVENRFVPLSKCDHCDLFHGKTIGGYIICEGTAEQEEK